MQEQIYENKSLKNSQNSELKKIYKNKYVYDNKQCCINNHMILSNYTKSIEMIYDKIISVILPNSVQFIYFKYNFCKIIKNAIQPTNKLKIKKGNRYYYEPSVYNYSYSKHEKLLYTITNIIFYNSLSFCDFSDKNNKCNFQTKNIFLIEHINNCLFYVHCDQIYFKIFSFCLR